MPRPKRRDATKKAVDEAMAAEGLTRVKDRQKIAEGLTALLEALPSAPSNPLDAGVRRRLGEAADLLDDSATDRRPR